MSEHEIISDSPDETFEIGARLGAELRAGDVVLLTGRLGAGKTLLTKGILSALEYDVDEVTSPSFTLVNLYKTERFNVYHIDLWRSDGGDPAFAVGLDEIVDDEHAILIIEWAEKLANFHFRSHVYQIDLAGDGDEPRRIKVKQTEQAPAANV
jgi:tRNA threonylcarbamoyladenosine biosynthesis protein TsaE